MDQMLTEILIWIPRVTGLLMAGFCYFFMLEIFSEGWKSGLMHFVQGTFMLAVALLAWKWGIIGGSIYVLLGLLVFFHFRRNQFTFILSSVIIATGLMFIFFHVFL